MDKVQTSKIAQRIRAFADPGDHHSLYPHQVEMLDAIATHLEQGETNGTLKAATGTGKTYALGALAVASDEPTVIITPRKLIGAQTAETFFDEKKFNVSVRDKVGVYDSNYSPAVREHALKKKILITTYASFINLVKEGKISDDPRNKNFRRNIILDEAHRATGEEFQKSLKSFVKNSIITAWTATDQFIDGTNVSERLFENPHRIYTLELEEAVRRGLLADAVHAIGVEVGVNAEDLEAKKKRHSDYPDHIVERFAKMEAVQEQAVEMYMNYTHPETHIPFRGLPCVVMTAGVNNAKKPLSASMMLWVRELPLL